MLSICKRSSVQNPASWRRLPPSHGGSSHLTGSYLAPHRVIAELITLTTKPHEVKDTAFIGAPTMLPLNEHQKHQLPACILISKDFGILDLLRLKCVWNTKWAKNPDAPFQEWCCTVLEVVMSLWRCMTVICHCSICRFKLCCTYSTKTPGTCLLYTDICTNKGLG